MDAVAPVEGDIVIDKLRPSLFEFTPAEVILMNLGVTRLVIAGLQTNVCVEATTRSAHNYEVAIAEDAVSTDGIDLHTGALNSMRVLHAESLQGATCWPTACRGIARSRHRTTVGTPTTGTNDTTPRPAWASSG